METPALAENKRQRSFLLSTVASAPSESAFTQECIRGIYQFLYFPIFSILHTNIRLLKFLLELPSLCLLLHILTLIINLLTAAESHVELYEAAFKVEAEGHKGIALLLDFSE